MESRRGKLAMAKALRTAAITIALGVMLTGPAIAQPVRLPIAEGVWVKTSTSCAAATNVYVYKGSRFGSVYFYGPNQSMGPANEAENLSHIGPGKNGFTVVNDGPIEVAARPKGRAAVRAYSLSEGPQWTETVRLCSKAALSQKLRSALVGLGLI